MPRHTCTYTIVRMHSVHHLLTILFLYYVHGCFAYMYFCAPHLFLMPIKARRGCWIPCCGPPCEYWELNPVFLTTDPSLQLYLLGDFSAKKIWMGCYKKVTGKHNSETKPDQVRLSLHKPDTSRLLTENSFFFLFFLFWTQTQRGAGCIHIACLNPELHLATELQRSHFGAVFLNKQASRSMLVLSIYVNV